MKLPKPSFILMCVLIISGTFLITSCPGPSSDPPLTSETFIVEIRQAYYGVIYSSTMAASPGNTVTVTAIPESGHVATNIMVMTSFPVGHLVPVSRIPSSDLLDDSTEWTFSMPSNNVVIGGRFAPLDLAAREAVLSLSMDSDWEEIREANALVTRAEARFGAPPVNPQVSLNINEAVNGLQSFVPLRMRNEVDAWGVWFPSAPAANRPTLPLQTGAALNNVNRTHLYFMGLTTLPQPNQANLTSAGWTIGISTTTDAMPVPPNEALIGASHHQLNFQVGLAANRYPLSYDVLLVPVAQYILVRGANVPVTAGMTIAEFSNPPGRWGGPSRERNIPGAPPGNQNQMERIGEVQWLDINMGATPTSTGEFTFVELRSPANFRFTVAPTGPASPDISWQCGCAFIPLSPDPSCDPNATGTYCGPLPGGGRARGVFIPRSRIYTITLSHAPASP